MQTFLFFSVSCLITSIIVFSRHLTTSIHGEFHPAHNLLGDVAINCGCLTNSTSLDGRYWVGEQQTPPLRLHPNGKSRRTSTSLHKLLTADPTPYLTARISSTHFSYDFQLNPGQKFIRLHFCPLSYQGFKNSQDFFTVKANSFTLLQNFSASLAACALGVKYVVKEFCLNVNETGNLQLTFFASQGSSKKSKNHAFVNGIEIISMPTGLYYTPDGDLGPPVVGHTNNFYNIDNSTALELIQRVNVGGGSILSVEDTGMFRRWSEDADYLLQHGFHQVDNLVLGIEYMKLLPIYVAPLKIYQTSRRLTKNTGAEEPYWKLSVDIGFNYLLRLHFYEFGVESVESSGQEFDILVQNLVAETRANVIRWSGGKGIPVYRDYLVKLKGDKADGKCDLSISLQSVNDLAVGTLKGIEIFKLSNTDNSLASPNPSCSKCSSSFWTLKSQNLSFGHFNFFMTVLMVLLGVLSATVHKFRQICDGKLWQEKEVQSVPVEPSCCYFTLAEILAATQNFNDALVIGRGGFGKVYKGIVDGHPQILAIKRLKSDSKQGAHEFWREIETLSKLRHVHLVSLIGYCNENKEMILVYEYMPRGTLADNLYKAGRNGEEAVPLTWQQRLRICIGAARGLDYLHTGSENGVIHRDVKDTNILLDENFVAKISDFGLSKLGRIRETQSQLSTKVKGTFGYLDPYYIITHKPSEKSDVYGYGIVLLVVLSGRPALEAKVYGETRSLLSCFRECITRGQFNDIIDPCLHGEISVESLQIFTEVVENCLHHSPKDRPSMAQAVVQLENAFGEQHRCSMASIQDDGTTVTQSGLASPRKSFESYELQLPSTSEETMGTYQEAGIISKQVLQSREKDRMTTQKSLWGRPWNALRLKSTRTKDLALSTGPIFSLQTIISATRNFSSELLIQRQKSSKVYKGFIGGLGPICVAFTDFYTYSKRMEEVQREIELLTKVRHVHLVPLLGFCIKNNNLILVYGYMSNGTLEDYLYNNTNTRKDSYSPTWEARLRICIDAARGLRYLHVNGIVHGNIEGSSIMLDENFKTKISDFWLANMVVSGPSDTRDFVYLDPCYFHTGKMTIATDVYAFGIFLLSVLSGRPAHQLRHEGQHQSLPWYETCLQEGYLDQVIDPNLEGKIPSASLGTFVHLIENCLLRDPELRSVMAQVEAFLVESLELALSVPTCGIALCPSLYTWPEIQTNFFRHGTLIWMLLQV